MQPPPPPPSPFPPFVPPPPPAAGRPNWWQRNWKWFVPTGCVTLLVLFAAFIAVIFGIVMAAMKSSGAYQGAVAQAKADPRVVRALGEPIEEGFFVAGSTNTAGSSGRSDLQIPLSGPKGKGTLYAVATKSEGVWVYSKLTVRVAGQPDPIILNPPR